MHIIQRIKDSYEFLAAVAIIIFLTDLEEGVTSEGQRPWYKEVLLFFEVVGLSIVAFILFSVNKLAGLKRWSQN